MKRQMIFIVLLCSLLSTIVFAQDTTTIGVRTSGNGIERLTFEFISDGDFDSTWAYRVQGEIRKIVIVPDATNPFEETMDIRVVDADSSVILTFDNVDSNASTVFTPVTTASSGTTRVQDLFIGDTLRVIGLSTGTQTKGKIDIYSR